MPKPKPEPRKPGRPKLSEADAKGKIVPVRFRTDEIEKIAKTAQLTNQTVSKWIRNTLATPKEGDVPNFVTINDGLSYFSIDQIEEFGVHRNEHGEKGTYIKFRNGHEAHISRPTDQVAELLNSCNLHY